MINKRYVRGYFRKDYFTYIRRSHFLTQEETAKLIGVHVRTISNWECGATIPHISNLRAICEAWEMSTDDFFTGDEELLRKDKLFLETGNLFWNDKRGLLRSHTG